MSNHDFKVDLSEGRNDFVKEVKEEVKEEVKAEIKAKAKEEVKVEDNTKVNINTKKELPIDKEFASLLLINLYEYFLGLVFGFLFNEFMYLIFPFKKESRPNVFVSFIFLIIFVTIIITCALILRKSTMFLPYISDIRKTYKLNHPPPIAMTFSLWRTINQLKKRSKYIQERIFEVSK